MSAADELAQARRDYADNQKAAVTTPVREEYGDDQNGDER